MALLFCFFSLSSLCLLRIFPNKNTSTIKNPTNFPILYHQVCSDNISRLIRPVPTIVNVIDTRKQAIGYVRHEIEDTQEN